MSITKRLVDLAKSNLNSLLEKAADTADPRRKLSDLSDAELEAELSRRRTTRQTEVAVNEARARVDAVDPPRPTGGTGQGGADGTGGSGGTSGAGGTSGTSAASATSKPNGATPGAARPAASGPSSAAADREARERAAREREARVKAARETRERDARAAQERQRAQSQQAKPPPRGGAGGAQPGAGARKPPRGADPMIAQYYARLEVPYGAPWDEVKAAYRRLMRKYHPDLHAHSPEKLKAATEVAQALTQAYNELDRLMNQ